MHLVLAVETVKTVGETSALVVAGGTAWALLSRYGLPLIRALAGKAGNTSTPTQLPVIAYPPQPAATSEPWEICIEHEKRLTQLEQHAESAAGKLDALQASVNDLPGQVVEAIKKANGNGANK